MEFSDYVETRTAAATLDGTELNAGSKGGVARKWTNDQVSSLAYRGDFDPTGDILPTGPTTLKGFRFKTSANYKGWQGIIEARQDNPTTEAHFNFYNLTTF